MPAVSPHRAVVAAGPFAIRRLCCGTDISTGDEVARTALDAIDDDVALLGARPVTVASLWRTALRSVGCPTGTGLVIVHPSWWSSSRIAVVTAAAAQLTGEVVVRPRSWLLTRASQAAAGGTVVVEIADRLVAVVAGAEMAAVPRKGEPGLVAEEIGRAVAGRAGAAVLIDAAGTDAGVARLAADIAEAVRRRGLTPAVVDDARLARLARSAWPEPSEPAPGGRARAPRRGILAACALILTAAPLAVCAALPVGRRDVAAAPRVGAATTTFLVEGRVTVEVPADWPAQRVVSGPGSARVQVASPSDPEVALLVTQSPVPGETLSGTAERLKRALDAEPGGVFADFDPSGSTAGRPAVTYREVRARHHVRWTVFVDGPVRISIGCQSRPGAEDAVRGVCEQAVRSARAIGI